MMISRKKWIEAICSLGGLALISGTVLTSAVDIVSSLAQPAAPAIDPARLQAFQDYVIPCSIPHNDRLDWLKSKARYALMGTIDRAAIADEEAAIAECIRTALPKIRD